MQALMELLHIVVVKDLEKSIPKIPIWSQNSSAGSFSKSTIKWYQNTSEIVLL